MILPQCVNTVDPCRCQAGECMKLWNTSTEEAEACYMDNCFIPKRQLDDRTLHQVTAAYVAILLVGVIGNVGTCIVIRRHPLLKTHSSSYLLNLAVSDLVTLCVGLPFEILMIWYQWPWPFPDSFCNLKALIAETTNSVSGLTILLFSVERYLAICHPFLFVKLKPIRKNVFFLLVFTWILSIICAVPYANHHKADYFIKNWPYTDDGPPVLSSKMCMLNIQHMAQDSNLEMEYFELKVLFHISAALFFALPLLIIVVLYFAIACKIKSRRRTVVYNRTDSTAADEAQFRVTFILSQFPNERLGVLNGYMSHHSHGASVHFTITAQMSRTLFLSNHIILRMLYSIPIATSSILPFGFFTYARSQSISLFHLRDPLLPRYDSQSSAVQFSIQQISEGIKRGLSILPSMCNSFIG